MEGLEPDTTCSGGEQEVEHTVEERVRQQLLRTNYCTTNYNELRCSPTTRQLAGLPTREMVMERGRLPLRRVARRLLSTNSASAYTKGCRPWMQWQAGRAASKV